VNGRAFLTLSPTELVTYFNRNNSLGVNYQSGVGETGSAIGLGAGNWMLLF
jgi:hypothetical protein